MCYGWIPITCKNALVLYMWGRLEHQVLYLLHAAIQGTDSEWFCEVILNSIITKWDLVYHGEQFISQNGC